MTPNKPETANFNGGNALATLSTSRRVVFTPSNPTLAKLAIRPGASSSAGWMTMDG